MSSAPLVVLAEPLEPEPAAWLAQRCRLVRIGQKDPDFGNRIERAHALIVRTYTRVDAPLLARAPALRVVARAGVGLDNIDLQACRDRGISVVHTPHANTTAVVEHVFRAILHIVRPALTIHPENVPRDQSEWRALREASVTPRQVSDLTLGVVGLGRVGGRVARTARAFDMRVFFCDLLDFPVAQRHGAQPLDFHRLLRECDLVSLHVDGRPANRGLIDAPELATLKHDAILVNSSRGFVVNTSALAHWLLAHPHARAVIDVHDPEPFDHAYPLLGLPNAILTPHTASATRTAKINMSWVVRDVWRVLSGEPPRYPAT